MINWYYFIFISSLWQILVRDSTALANWKPRKEISCIKSVYSIFWTPCMWYNLSSFIRCIPFTIHSCLESLVSSGSVLNYYGYNALIGLTINLFYFAIMKASINNSDFFGKYYWKYFIYKCYTKKGFLGIFFRPLCKINPKHLYKMYFIPDDACKA